MYTVCGIHADVFMIIRLDLGLILPVAITLSDNSFYYDFVVDQSQLVLRKHLNHLINQLFLVPTVQLHCHVTCPILLPTLTLIADHLHHYRQRYMYSLHVMYRN